MDAKFSAKSLGILKTFKESSRQNVQKLTKMKNHFLLVSLLSYQQEHFKVEIIFIIFQSIQLNLITLVLVV